MPFWFGSHTVDNCTVAKTSLGLDHINIGPKDKINLFWLDILKGATFCLVGIKYSRVNI